MSFFELLKYAFGGFWDVYGFDDKVIPIFLGFMCASKVFFDMLVFPV
jgi:hypothetical protein